jgi:hypothetical protein
MMSKPQEKKLLQLRRDAVELGVEGRADRVDGCDDHDRNSRGDQTVFNRGRPGFILEKRNNSGHVLPPWCSCTSAKLRVDY